MGIEWAELSGFSSSPQGSEMLTAGPRKVKKQNLGDLAGSQGRVPSRCTVMAAKNQLQQTQPRVRFWEGREESKMLPFGENIKIFAIGTIIERDVLPHKDRAVSLGTTEL